MADLSDIERMVDDWERDAVAKAQRYQRMQDEVGQISITESAANGAVSVTVGGNGIPTGVAMTDAVRSMSPDEIAGAVLNAMQKAQSRYPERIQEIVAETVGDDSTSRHIVEAAVENFPPPPAEEDEPRPPEHQLRIGSEADEEQPPPPRPPRRARHRRDDDEDFGDQTYLRRD